MQSAIELGIEGPEVDTAKEDLAKMNAEDEQAKKNERRCYCHCHERTK